MTKLSSEFNHYGLGVSIARFINEVLELIEVVVYRAITLKVSCTLQYVDRGGLRVGRGKGLLELIFEVHPVQESEFA